jgi:MoxR-like ATPase
MPMTPQEAQAQLSKLFAKGCDGFSRDLLAVLPHPWDAPSPIEVGEAYKPPPYLVDDDLAGAAWVSLLLRQPLLLTGDPGVGKTRFAEKLADDLGIGRPTLVQVKSTTSGRELLYKFDDLMRFRDATIAGAIMHQTAQQAESNQNSKGDPKSSSNNVGNIDADDAKRAERALVSYVRMEGLGRAILRAAGSAYPIVLDPDFDRIEVFGADAAKKDTLTLADVFPQEFLGNTGPRHTLVLIDELDKAPRDTPNDLLGEIERMTFRFDELGFSVAADPKYKPIVVITSNAERNLPDAFLRRCVFHHIATPDRERMCKIAAARLGGGLDPKAKLVTDAWDLFDKVSKVITEKKPGTAEFIALVAYLRATDAGSPLDEARVAAALRIFNKTKVDLATADVMAGAAPAAKR